MQGLDEASRVRRTVEEIGIAKRDVLRAGLDLRRDIGQHDLRLDDAELSLVDRHDGTMSAQMAAPSARLGVPDHPALAATELERGIPMQRQADLTDRARGTGASAAARSGPRERRDRHRRLLRERLGARSTREVAAAPVRRRSAPLRIRRRAPRPPRGCEARPHSTAHRGRRRRSSRPGSARAPAG